MNQGTCPYELNFFPANIANISFSSIIQNFGLYRFPIKNINNLIFDISVKYENVLNRLNKELAKWISTINTETLFKKRFINVS